MKRSRIWPAITGLAFAAWIGYLVYQTLHVERPSIILSRPQFLLAECVIIGQIEAKHDSVMVDEVFFAAANAKVLPGTKIHVENLSGSLRNWTSQAPDAEWDVPGKFIIPLHNLHLDGKKGDLWEAVVVGLPPSPGSPTGTRVYPKTEGTMEQLRSIPIGK
jgi:hypothetical protein